MCVPLCWKHHALILKQSRAAPCVLNGLGGLIVWRLYKQTNKQSAYVGKECNLANTHIYHGNAPRCVTVREWVTQKSVYGVGLSTGLN